MEPHSSHVLMVEPGEDESHYCGACKASGFALVGPCPVYEYLRGASEYKSAIESNVKSATSDTHFSHLTRPENGVHVCVNCREGGEKLKETCPPITYSPILEGSKWKGPARIEFDVHASHTISLQHPNDLICGSCGAKTVATLEEPCPAPGLAERVDQTIKKFSPVDNTSGSKHDQHKPRWSLLPLEAINDVIAVLEYGAKKYGEWNWIKVTNSRERYFNAAMRHLIAWYSGERVDPESGHSHLAHAMCSLLFLAGFEAGVKPPEVKP